MNKEPKTQVIMMAYFRIADEGCEMLELGPTCGMGLDYGNVPCAGGITLIAPINGVRRIVDSNHTEFANQSCKRRKTFLATTKRDYPESELKQALVFRGCFSITGASS